jgi:transcriptional regulator with XRE-family HTH domain
MLCKFPKLFQLMAERGVNAVQLSKGTGISTGNISDWKNGKAAPSSKSLAKLAAFFNVSTDYLLGSTSQDHFAEKHGEPTELERILEQTPGLMFHGAPLTEEDRAKLITAMHAVMAVEDKKHKK